MYKYATKFTARVSTRYYQAAGTPNELIYFQITTYANSSIKNLIQTGIRFDKRGSKMYGGAVHKDLLQNGTYKMYAIIYCFVWVETSDRG